MLYFLDKYLSFILTLLIPGLLGADSPPPPLHNFSISYASALKHVTGVHQRLMNTLAQKI